MDKLEEIFRALQTDRLNVATWEIMFILAVATASMIFRSAKAGLFITYIFALHIAFSFFKEFFSKGTLLIFGIVFAGILLIGIYEAITNR